MLDTHKGFKSIAKFKNTFQLNNTDYRNKKIDLTCILSSGNSVFMANISRA